MLAIPEVFASATLNREGEAGRLWLESLAKRLERLLDDWQLELDGAAIAASMSLIIPVIQAKEPLILKFAWPDETSCYEALALDLWQGRGAVKLLNQYQAYSALLLERLDSMRPLENLPPDQALDIASDLYQRLWLAAPEGIPKQAAMVEQLRANMQERWRILAEPFPKQWLDMARVLALELSKPENPVLVNYDLHQGNVLGSSREPWLVIDPKVIAADREFGIAQLFWYQLNVKDQPLILKRLDRFIDRDCLDQKKAYAWTFIRCLDYWLWGLSVGLTQDPLRCEALGNALVKKLVSVS